MNRQLRLQENSIVDVKILFFVWRHFLMPLWENGSTFTFSKPGDHYSTTDILIHLIIKVLPGQSPQNCCVKKKIDISKCSNFITIGFTTFKEYDNPLKKHIWGHKSESHYGSERKQLFCKK